MDLLKWFLDGIVRFYSQSPPAVQLFFLVVMLALIVLVTVWTTWSYFRKRHQLEGVKAERDGFKGQLQEKGYQVLELQTKLTTADGLCQQLQQQTQTLSTQNGQLQQQLSTEQQKLDAASQQLVHCQGELAALRKRFDDLQEVDTDVWLGDAEPSVVPPPFVHRNDRKVRLVAFLNLKGGVGKTTLVANLGTAFATGLTGVSHRPTSEADAIWPAGGGLAHDGLVGVAPARTGATPSTTVRARGCGLRKCRLSSLTAINFIPGGRSRLIPLRARCFRFLRTTSRSGLSSASSSDTSSHRHVRNNHAPYPGPLMQRAVSVQEVPFTGVFLDNGSDRMTSS